VATTLEQSITGTEAGNGRIITRCPRRLQRSCSLAALPESIGCGNGLSWLPVPAGRSGRCFRYSIYHSAVPFSTWESAPEELVRGFYVPFHQGSIGAFPIALIGGNGILLPDHARWLPRYRDSWLSRSFHRSKPRAGMRLSLVVIVFPLAAAIICPPRRHDLRLP
jgi:hypothetical protein